jgi:hypothetical protein
MYLAADSFIAGHCAFSGSPAGTIADGTVEQREGLTMKKATSSYLFLLPLGATLCLALSGAYAQRVPTPGERTTAFSLPAWGASNSLPQIQTRTHAPGKIVGKKVTNYTAEEWGTWIDSTWGAGQTATQQLHVFDTFWDGINTTWGGFPNLSLNWDSIRALYRPQISSGLSRGRFAALMSRVWMPLLEYHTYIYDLKVDTTFGDDWAFWRYKPGIPLLLIGTQWRDPIGAPITAMQDSNGLVYRAVPGHPLGLQPGDVILGYEGVPWKQLYPRLLEMGVPVNRYWSSPGSTPESRQQLAMSAVGWNWGMFDTIDVVKYATGDTVHMPTAPLATSTQAIWASDQVPIPGVQMPEGSVSNTNAVSWGVVQGTNIGYIYVWDWYTSMTAQRFSDAVTDLRYAKNVDGLVIDFRMNLGGEVEYANAGFARLFGFDPTSNWAFATRASPSDHLSFGPIQLNFGFTPGISFDRPIAMLIGPGCLSAGDYNAFRLRFHPMARSFGKPTNGAFVAAPQRLGSLEQDWNYEYWSGLMSSLIPGEGYMIHKGVQPDESVWLTRDCVAKGEDDVVKRALGWMESLSYAHDVKVGKDTVRNPSDSIRITAQVKNPGHHALIVSAIAATPQGSVADSVVLAMAPGDSLWHAFLKAPRANGRYNISVRTDDVTSGTYRRLPNVAWFTAIVTDVHALAEDLPKEFGLQQNFPNPFNPSTTIQYGLPNRSYVTLKVFNMLGQTVALLQNGEQEAGYHKVQFDGRNLSSGVYLYRMQAGEFVQTRRLLLLK